MADFWEVVPGLVVDSDGEIIEAADIDDPMKFLAAMRHDAKCQAKEWESRVDNLDRVLLKKQAAKVTVYGDIVSAVKGGTYNKTDARRFADLILDAFPQAFDLEHEEAVAAVLAVLAAATGFKKDLLPDGAGDLYSAATAVIEKRPWVETSIARRPAPARVAPKGEAVAPDVLAEYAKEYAGGSHAS